jgi:2-methylisocitrate lyase-like PEP mutase family enzyme
MGIFPGGIGREYAGGLISEDVLSMNQQQSAKAQAFRQMHDRSGVLLLPNAWDAGSARLFASRGFAAIATTSGGVAWSLGYADGEQVPLDEVLAAMARITRVTDLPVTADIEAGYGATAADVGETVRAVIGTGPLASTSRIVCTAVCATWPRRRSGSRQRVP